jgi:hypothetical protein
MFRTIFYQNAVVLLSAFMRCGAHCLDDFYSTVRGKTLQGGSITVLHTHGRNGQYHPHLHLLATSGGMMPRVRTGSISSICPMPSCAVSGSGIC